MGLWDDRMLGGGNQTGSAEVDFILTWHWKVVCYLTPNILIIQSRQALTLLTLSSADCGVPTSLSSESVPSRLSSQFVLGYKSALLTAINVE